ncbi:hypothetical protein D1AOALGA4SA_1251 [Olavius algarvensis Delta 1 endosymbiont]|nr:hypothetical protein D1AOALGA4SA_1251 [Olavius algarvensis Delta 1 endosymbiont]
MNRFPFRGRERRRARFKSIFFDGPAFFSIQQPKSLFLPLIIGLV